VLLVVYGCAMVMEVVGVVQCCERGVEVVEVVVVGVAQGRKELGVVR
jgi:hypothetical protein